MSRRISPHAFSLQRDLSQEINRIGTFFGWPGHDQHNRPIRPSALNLAEAGFYFTGKGDEVRCFSCDISIESWEKHNVPLTVHATRNPHCAFVLKQEISNRPVMVPQERDYASIVSMLDKVGEKVMRTIGGHSYSASSLISDTLRQLYGDTMMADSRRPQLRPQAAANPPSVQTPTPNATRISSMKKEQGRRSRNSSSSHSPTPGPQRQNSPSSQSSSKERPLLHRARSYASDPRAVPQVRSSETIPNRQNSNPGVDHSVFQDSEEARLATFKEWPGVRGSSAQEFAQAGFIFFGRPDRVQCVFCYGILRNWNDNDIPMEEHRKHFPQCPFVQECQSSALNLAKPRYSKYKTKQSRLESFEKWNPMTVPAPEALAEAGFFFIGHGDSVKCFFCDGGLRNWESDDDPWREHARWFPKCGYVKTSKGKAYIESVIQNTNLAEYQTASVDANETHVKNVIGQGQQSQREVDPREVMARMDSPIVKAALKMDIPKHLVRKAIKKKLAEDGGDFSSTEALIVAVFAEEADERDSAEPEVQEGMSETPEESSGPESKDSDESLRLMEENRQLKEQRQCKICMDEEVCVAFLPCGHLVCCSTCAPALNACPICRAKIRGTVRTYMS